MKLKFVAKTVFGLEEVLSAELLALGASNLKAGNRAVEFEADFLTFSRIAFWSRVSLRLLFPIESFKAHNEIVYYKRLRRIDWTDYLSIDTRFAIQSTANSEIFTHSQYLALKTKDAIVDQFRERNNGRRPSVDLDKPDLVIDVYCKGKEFTISLSASAQSLHQRGYRQSNRPAPLNEVLAAGMLLLADWKGETAFLDPMCGSGTLLTEAYLIAGSVAPRRNWEQFSINTWPFFEAEIWKQVAAQADSFKKEVEVPIYGMDIDPVTVSETKQLVQSLGMNSNIEVRKADFFTNPAPFGEGLLIMNPPYGRRLELSDPIDFYKQVGDRLKNIYTDWDAWILSSNHEAIKNVGLKTSARKTLFNGPLECKYFNYKLYRGSRKSKTE